MTHPDMFDANTTSANARETEAEGSEQERPVPSVDERHERPTNPLQQAREFAAAGEMTAALTTVRALIAREPRTSRARYLLAELLAHKGDVEGAVGELGRALEATPDDSQILCARAALYTARGK
jgi:thioredoxin-like negative regulator of GroEL